VQANKAGLMEIADVFVINKADRDGVRQTRHDLKAMLQMGDARGWTPPIVEAVATEGQGAAELWEAIDAHQEHLRATGELEVRRRRRLRGELESVVTERLRQRAAELAGAVGSQGLIEQVQTGEIDPYTAADELLGPLGA
jgi:LAO/AO transport system kinase